MDLSAAFQSAACSIAVTRVQNRSSLLVHANEDFYRMHGVAKESYLLQPAQYDRAALSAADATQIRAALAHAAESGAFYCSDSFRKYALSQQSSQAPYDSIGSLDTVHPEDIPVL